VVSIGPGPFPDLEYGAHDFIQPPPDELRASFGVVVSTEETPFDQLQPDSITIAQLVDGAAAIDLLQKVQLL
jgi:hypothetical protein